MSMPMQTSNFEEASLRKPRWPKWALFVGVITLLVVLFAGGIVALVFWLMKSNDAYAIALQKAQQSPALKAAIGEPIEPGFLVSGSIKMSGDAGRAHIYIPLAGPKGTAWLTVRATKEAGVWTHNTLSAQVDRTGQTIDVLRE